MLKDMPASARRLELTRLKLLPGTVGYGADEAGTLETLRRYRAAMATLIERHDGRVVNTWGDAVIAEFPSVVEAVQCAVETQLELSTYNGGMPEPRRKTTRWRSSARRSPPSIRVIAPPFF